MTLPILNWVKTAGGTMVEVYENDTLSAGGKSKKAQIGRCPLCKRDVLHSFRPFCSQKCKMVDLYRWVSGHYVIPGDPERFMDEESAEALDEWKNNDDDRNL